MGIDHATTRIWRRGVALLVVGDLAVMVGLTLSEASVYKAWLDAPGAFGWLATTPVALLAIAAVQLFVVSRFLREGGGLLWGVAALALGSVLNHALGAVHGTFATPFFYTGGALLGWLLGRLAARAVGLDPQRDLLETERFAATAALALFSAAYMNAAISKLSSSGWSWTDPTNLQLIVLARVEYGDPSPLASLQWLVVENPGVARFMAGYTIVVELLAPLVLLGRRARLVWTTLLVGMHAGILVLMGILFMPAIYLCVLYGFPWWRFQKPAAEPDAPAPPSPAPAVRPPWRFVGVAAVLAVGLAFAPIERFRDPVDSRSQALPGTLTRLGPIAVGDTLGGGWSVGALFSRGASADVELVRGPDRVLVELAVPAAETPRSGLDAAGLAIRHHETSLTFAVIADGVRALVERLAKGAQPGTLGAALPRWLDD